VRQTGRKKIVIAAMWTEVCLAMVAIQALGEGYEVYFVTDASGGFSVEAHEMAILRMVQAGAVPVTWLVVGAEMQRDWARTDTLPAFVDIVSEHTGVVGVSFRWEQQLLQTQPQ
jgi:nicotinamidase-related amidase